MRKTVFDAIGTKWSIEILEEIPNGKWENLTSRIDKRIERFDKNYSRFRGDSLVTKMSQKPGRYQLPPDGFKLLAFYEKLYKLNQGQVTPLIGQTLADAGYDADYSLKPRTLSQPPAWQDVISYDKDFIELKQPALLDFGAAGKGYLVDIVASLIENASVKNFVINAGGDILHRSTSGAVARVGLENPLDSNQAVGIIDLSNQSLCASAGSRRQWDKYNHILDPRKLKSPTHIIATWVVASDAITADGLATALFFCEPAILKEHFDFAYAALNKDMALSYSEDLKIEVFSQ